jgi:hypothetical protein
MNEIHKLYLHIKVRNKQNKGGVGRLITHPFPAFGDP